MRMTVDQCKPGQQVRITHTIERRDEDWLSVTEGVIESIDLQKTGSWYAHSKDNKFWLRRLRLRKPDGEITLVNIDPYTTIELVPPTTN